MRLHYLQHVPFEDAANVAVWAERHGHAVTVTRLYQADPLPDLSAIDWLAIMGGPMNIYEHEAYPWLPAEKEYLRRAIQRGLPLLGVCLGAQLVADVLGGPVTRNPFPEIGWHRVWRTEDGATSRLFETFPAEFVPFHWHGDTFQIPPRAVRLASSEACENQAFQFGDRVIGLQFHLDYSADSIRRMIDHCGDELRPGPHVETDAARLIDTDRAAGTQALLDRLLDSLHERGEVSSRRV
jgi:GMP synthase-like glutamine amidotransferase